MRRIGQPTVAERTARMVRDLPDATPDTLEETIAEVAPVIDERRPETAAACMRRMRERSP